MGMLFTPKGFLRVGGVVLLAVGIIGFFGIIGPEAEDSVFGDSWWFDNGENAAHAILGAVALLAAQFFPAPTHRPLVLLVGLLGLAFGVFNLFEEEFLGANLENPADTILHFAVGAWGLLAGLRKTPATKPMATPMQPM